MQTLNFVDAKLKGFTVIVTFISLYGLFVFLFCFFIVLSTLYVMFIPVYIDFIVDILIYNCLGVFLRIFCIFITNYLKNHH